MCVNVCEVYTCAVCDMYEYIVCMHMCVYV